MKAKQITSLIMALLILTGAFSSCGGTKTDDQPDIISGGDIEDSASDEDAETETEPMFVPDDLPDTLNFDGNEVHIFGWERNVPEFTVESETGDIVNDAIYQRNRTVEERLGVRLTYTLAPGNNSNMGQWTKTVMNSTLSADGSNDIVGGYSMAGASLAYNHMLIDLAGQQYLDFTKPWWPASLINEAAVNGRLYFCSGDISDYLIYYLNAVFFNKKLTNAYDVGDLYSAVRDGSWTLDMFAEKSANAYEDLNGNGKKDANDQFGMTMSSVCADSLYFSSGLRISGTDEEGLPVISEDFGSEKTQALVSYLVDLFKTESAYLSTDDNYQKPFLESRAMFFLVDVEFASTKLRYTDIEYGILPIPKYDEQQQDYKTISSFTYTLYGIPIDAKNPECSAAVLECLGSEAYRTVSPALFETALKVKYADDEDTSDMYDIIRAGVVFDIARIFCNSMDNMSFSMFRTSLIDKNPNWISKYESNSKKLEKLFGKVIEALTQE